MNFKKHSTPLSAYSSSSKFSTLQNLELAQLSQTFQVLDEDHDGLIKASELIEIFSEVQVENCNDLSYRYLVKLAEMQPNFLIDFNKFVQIIQAEIGSFGGGQKNRRQELKTMFELYDEGRGKIGVSQMTKIVERLGQPYSKQKVEELIKQFGVSNQTSRLEITQEDFYNLITQKTY